MHSFASAFEPPHPTACPYDPPVLLQLVGPEQVTESNVIPPRNIVQFPQTVVSTPDGAFDTSDPLRVIVIRPGKYRITYTLSINPVRFSGGFLPLSDENNTLLGTIEQSALPPAVLTDNVIFDIPERAALAILGGSFMIADGASLNILNVSDKKEPGQ